MVTDTVKVMTKATDMATNINYKIFQIEERNFRVVALFLSVKEYLKKRTPILF